MKKTIIAFHACLFLAFAVTNACKHKQAMPVSYGGFPADVGKIFIERCATSGCHNQQTHANNLVLDSWDNLFKGASSGAVVIPYSTKHSLLLYSINTDAANGLPLGNPTMPVDGTPLSADEFKLIYNWVQNGAPNVDGKVAFADNTQDRQKIYIAGVDNEVAVVDGASRLIMRYLDLNVDLPPGSTLHCLRLSPDGNYGFAGFTGGNTVKRFSALIDNPDLSLPGIPSGGTVYIGNDNTVLTTNFASTGGMRSINGAAMTQKGEYLNMVFPHGIAADENMDTMYVTAQYGNTIYKLSRSAKQSSDIRQISLDGKTPLQADAIGKGPDPHEILMLPGNNKYVVTCDYSNEVMILDAHTNTILKTLNTGLGSKPQEIAISKKQHLVFVSCLEDKQGITSNLYIGSVFVFDYNNPDDNWKIAGNFFNHPHGIAVDDRHDVIYVASTNATGPKDHHPSLSGLTGYFQYFNTRPPNLALDGGRKIYTTVAPYSADVRFKDAKQP